ncbi:MAG: hypothetical protein ABI948_08355 [Thermoleophilia bacterium]
MSAPWCEWWGDDEPPASTGARPLEPPDSIGVCAECDLDTPAEERHCGLDCPLSVIEARARARYGADAIPRYPRIVRLGVPTP